MISEKRSRSPTKASPKRRAKSQDPANDLLLNSGSNKVEFEIETQDYAVEYCASPARKGKGRPAASPTRKGRPEKKKDKKSTKSKHKNKKSTRGAQRLKLGDIYIPQDDTLVR